MSMPRTVRHINETRALTALLKRGPMSRADLARDLGITRATASSIVQSLSDTGFIYDDPIKPNACNRRTGRPSTLVRLRSDHAIFLGASVGVKHVSFATVDMTGEAISSSDIELDVATLELSALSEIIATNVRRLARSVQNAAAIQGLSLAVPGPVNRDGVVMRAPLLGWTGVPLKRLVQEALPEIPVTNVDNDANAFAIAEMHREGRQDNLDAVYLFVEDGVGGCVVHRGSILLGHDGFAGELGHIIVGEIGFDPRPTIRGSLESFVARSALLARHRSYGGSGDTLRAFIELLGAGETAARLALDDWAIYLGRGLATLVSVFNPERIILGGAVTAVFPFARQAVERNIRENLLHGAPDAPIERAELGSGAPAYGAALIQHKQFFALDEEILFGVSPAPA
jgi:predicted NBD/HSP70 family sugar kinase